MRVLLLIAAYSAGYITNNELAELRTEVTDNPEGKRP